MKKRASRKKGWVINGRVTVRDPKTDLATWRLRVTQNQSRSKRVGDEWPVLVSPWATGPMVRCKQKPLWNWPQMLPSYKKAQDLPREVHILQEAPFSPTEQDALWLLKSPSTPICSLPSSLWCHKARLAGLETGKGKVEVSGSWMPKNGLYQSSIFYHEIRSIFICKTQENGDNPLASLFLCITHM